jgi:hypothetical protein
MAVVRLHLAKGDGPRFPLRTLANTRRDRHMTAQSLDEFESALGAVHGLQTWASRRPGTLAAREFTRGISGPGPKTDRQKRWL